MTPDWDTIGYIISSKYRLAVLTRLHQGPSTPSKIAKQEGVSITHVSRALRRLEDRSIVALQVPDDQRKQRIYDLTDQGETLWETIRRNGLAGTDVTSETEP